MKQLVAGVRVVVFAVPVFIVTMLLIGLAILAFGRRNADEYFDAVFAKEPTP